MFVAGRERRQRAEADMKRLAELNKQLMQKDERINALHKQIEDLMGINQADGKAKPVDGKANPVKQPKKPGKN